MAEQNEKSFEFTFSNEELDENKEDCDNEFEIGTQPIEPLNEHNMECLSQGMQQGLSCDDIWGWLQPTPDSKLKSFALRKESYSFGRHLESDFVLRKEDFPEEALFLATSKTQFKIEKTTIGRGVETVFLYDLSLNGTFVNKEKVGQGKRVILTNNDEIALIFPLTRVFVFVDNSFTRGWMTPDMKGRFNLKVLLGIGAFGEVRMAWDKTNNKDVAIKKIKKRAGKEHVITNEIEILRKLKHHYIVSMEDVFDSSNYVYIVLEYISGGTLSSKVRNLGILSNDDAKFICYQLVLALEYLHQQKVAHRDLKPDNVLLWNFEDSDIVKLTDFGLSKLSSAVDTDLNTVCGTPYYTAPEIIQSRSLGSYTHQVDIWSLGVTTFYCLSGLHPFHSDRGTMSVNEQIVRGSYRMGVEWKGVCPKAINITKKMLVVNPSERITLPMIMEHPWFQDEAMKGRLRRVMRKMKNASEGNENVSTEYARPPKRARHDTTDDHTLRKS